MNIIGKIKVLLSSLLRGDILNDQNRYQEKLRDLGANIGNNCRIFSNIIGPETYLITLEDNVTIATGVKIITHDNAISKSCPEFTDIFGKVIIKKNCFIGAYSILLSGVTIGENAIIAAGAVVSKSVPEGEIWGGVPAKKIGTVEHYKKHNMNLGISIRGLDYSSKKEFLLSSNKLIVR